MSTKTNNHNLNPLAYFITFTCYGTWLPGDKKSFIDRNHNHFATPYLLNKPTRAQGAKEAMNEPLFLLNTENRHLILNTIKEVCTYRRWNLFAAHVRTNHIHCVINADVTPEKVMDVIKAYASRALNKKGCDRKKYWTRHGSTKYLWKSEDMVLTIRYVLFEQGEPMAAHDSEQYELTLDEVFLR